MKKEEKKVSKKIENVSKKVDTKKLDSKKADVKKTDTKKRDKYVAEKTTKKEKNKKENIFKRIGKYFKGVGKEIKRIRWTTGKELVKYSIAAISFVLFFGIYFYGVDWLAVLIRDFDEIVRSLAK